MTAGFFKCLQNVAVFGDFSFEMIIGSREFSGSFVHTLLELDDVPPDLLMQPRLLHGDGEAICHLLRDFDMLSGESAATLRGRAQGHVDRNRLASGRG